MAEPANMDQRPDMNTLAWWNSRFAEQLKATRGATHGMHLAIAELQDCVSTIKALQGAVESQAVALGALQSQVTELMASMTKARTAYSELRTAMKAES